MKHDPIEHRIQQTSSAEAFGARLARLRRGQGLSKTDVAEHLGISITAICHWEQDRSRPRSARLNALADLFGVSTVELLGEQRAPSQHKLADVVARARTEIAQAAGTNPSKVRITIEI